MRRRALAAALAVAVFALGAAVAWAVPADIKNLTGSDDYVDGTYLHDSGEVANYTWSAGPGAESHNVTANLKGPDGKALFRSKTIHSGSTPVNGTQYLPDGEYNFFCTIHGHSMSAELDVSGGTPVARPTVNVDAIVSSKVKRVRKQGKLLARVTTTGDGAATLTAKLGHRTLGTVKTANLGGATTTATIKLSRSAKNLLKGRKKATVKVTAGIDYGSPDSLSRKLT